MRRRYEQTCPVACSLDLVGERWTLLLVRDLLHGPLRFGELRRRFPDLAPNLLSARLRHLAEAGLVERLPERQGYRLTERGRELRFVLGELARFGVGLLDGVDALPFPSHLAAGGLHSLALPEHLDRRGWTALVELDGDLLLLTVDPARRGVRQAARVHVAPAPDGGDAPLRVVARADDLRRRRARVALEGEPWAIERFEALFGLGLPQAGTPAGKRSAKLPA